MAKFSRRSLGCGIIVLPSGCVPDAAVTNSVVEGRNDLEMVCLGLEWLFVFQVGASVILTF